MTTPNTNAPAMHGAIEALRDLRLGVEMDRHNLDDGDAKIQALDAAIEALSKLRAPVAGEAKPVPKCERCGNFGHEPKRCTGRTDHPGPLYAAPQASEAVGIEEAFAGLDDRLDAARWRMAVGLWRIKRVEVFDGVHLSHTSGIPWADLKRQIDAALSAQPGAQKSGGSDAE
ncbi:hypothetical protein [Achromobacter sp. UBA2119]|uniref:hypothetical protein n=1 Tax=Achromobacter sp. UBA2119 TaxID=1945911 RepID=UPI0025810813|nr:hypothetical protein [Achromobacter sp. UBA2119]